MKNIDEIADSFLREAVEDYVGLWAIADAVKWDLSLSDGEEVKARTLDVVGAILKHGLWPGDYLKTGFHFWHEEDGAAVIARIDRAWKPGRSDPNLGESICWFGKRPA